MKDEHNYGGSSHLPSQKVFKGQRTEEWKQNSLNYYVNFRYTNGSDLRSTRNRKIVNYDLANGRVDLDDIRKICDPSGTSSASFSESFMHHDKISPIIHELLGEESIKPDNALVYSESATDISRKTEALKAKMLESLNAVFQAEIDPASVDPNNPPETPEQILKAEKMNPSDTIESKANKMLKILKKKLNTKLVFNQGFKDALIVGEELYWTGILNGEPALRRCNPLNMTFILDDNDVFIDDAIAVIEERLLTIPSIIDEYGDLLSKQDLEKLDRYSQGTYGTYNTAGGFDPVFTVKNGVEAFSGATPNSNGFQSNNNNYAINVTRVEWMGMKYVGTLTYTDEEGNPVSEVVDESFRGSVTDFKVYYPDANVDWFWINDAWEGVKIGEDVYLGVQPKENQPRRMDNPYYTSLGYRGFLYEATNSESVSVIDRVKSLQYMYNIISWKLQLIFGSDMGKVMLMDLAQIPHSEGFDIDKWMMYLKESNIAFVNSFEEGKKGASTGKLSNFNQFQSIDMSLAQSVQQYIGYLQYLDQQIYNVSGVSQQRMGKIHQDEAVQNVEQTIQQSETITQYLFDSHQEVKRRVYTALIEVAKVAWREGKVTQYINDDETLSLLNIGEMEFENSDFAVFVSNLNKDKIVKNRLEELSKIAMEQQKVDLSDMVDVVLNDSPKDIVGVLKRAEAEAQQRQEAAAKAEQDAQAQMKQDALAHEEKQWAHNDMEAEKDRALDKYKIDQDNATKIAVQEIGNYFNMADTDSDNDGIPDPLEVGKQALERQSMESKSFNDRQKLANDKSKSDKEIRLKDKELSAKKAIEEKKIDAIRVQNVSQEKMQDKKIKSDEKLAKMKMQTEKAKAKAKPKPKK